MVFFIDLSVFGQKNNDLSNETIIEMYSKGLPTSIIASRLSSSANTFDISADALIKFTENKLPDDLINAIVDAALDSTRHLVIPGSKNNVLSNENIINMYNKGISPSIIALQINKAANTFDVSTEALIKLTNNKIPEDLITAMIEAAGDLNRHMVMPDPNNPNDRQESGISSIFKNEDTVTDADGNVYNTVIIGTQTWMVENMKTTKYNDGTSITLKGKDYEWKNSETPGYCWYNNVYSNKKTFGALYNWHAVNTGKLAPNGWHVPTDAEFTQLTNYLDEKKADISAQKEPGSLIWSGLNNDPNNQNGIAPMGGYRNNIGKFGSEGKLSIWWSSTENNAGDAWVRYLNLGYSVLGRNGSYFKGSFFSVRCIKD